MTRHPRLAVDFVSPLPPVRSGIADYSLDLLPHLAELADVRVLGLPGQPVDPDVARRFAVVPAAEARPAGGWGEDRLPLYQMGNNRYHSGVEAMALARPGVLTLHDLVLHHLVSEETLGERDFAAYRTRLVVDHGWIGEAVAAPREWGAEVGAALFELPVHRRLVRRQRGILVHNRWAAERIRREEPDVRVEVVPMGVPLPPPADRAAGLAFRRRYGLPEDALVLGSFGFQTPIKRTVRVVEALARLGAGSLSGVHLLVVGEGPAVGPGGEVSARARELGVAERVHETGFVPFAELAAAIAASDLGLNLRYPTAGETSASLLRVLAVGRPAIVSDYAQFAELPDDVVVKVPLGGVDGDDDEVPALAARLAELLAAPRSASGRLAAMGRAAREHVRRRHDPAAAARAVAAACREWAAATPPGDRPVAVPPPTSRVWESFPGTIEVARAGGRGRPGPWPEGERRHLAVTLTNAGPARWLAAHRGAGGIGLQAELLTPAGDLLAGRPWLGLPRDLEPGESWTAELELRRPPGPATLRLVPQVLGGFPLGDPFLGGATLTWEGTWEGTREGTRRGDLAWL